MKIKWCYQNLLILIQWHFLDHRFPKKTQDGWILHLRFFENQKNLPDLYRWQRLNAAIFFFPTRDSRCEDSHRGIGESFVPGGVEGFLRSKRRPDEFPETEWGGYILYGRILWWENWWWRISWPIYGRFHSRVIMDGSFPWRWYVKYHFFAYGHGYYHLHDISTLPETYSFQAWKPIHFYFYFLGKETIFCWAKC